MMTLADSVLQFWFGDDLESPHAVAKLSQQWFASDPTFDGVIRERFGSLPDRVLNGDFSDWRMAARPTLALLLVLDQFTRNLFRGSAESVAYDAAAVEISLEALALGFDGELHPLEAVFLYLPFEHAEDMVLQGKSVALFRKLAERAPRPLADQFSSFLEFAEQHQVVIEQFGRFPHRNAVLGRQSTAEEVEFLRSDGKTFSAADRT